MQIVHGLIGMYRFALDMLHTGLQCMRQRNLIFWTLLQGVHRVHVHTLVVRAPFAKAAVEHRNGPQPAKCRLAGTSTP